MKQWHELKEKHPDAILLFSCGDYYEVYGRDARTCGDLLGIKVRHFDEDATMYAGFPYIELGVYLPKLIRAGKRVAIVDELNPPPPKRKYDDDETNESEETTSETNISNNSNITTMAKNVKGADLIGKVLVLSDGKSKYVIKSIDGDKLSAEFSRGEGAAANVMLTVAQVESMISAGKAAWSDDTTSTSVEEVEEVSAITPTKPVAQTVDMKPTTKPKAKNEKPKGEKKGETKGVQKPASDNGKTKSTLKYETYQNKKGKTCARIVGFREDDAAYQQAAELHGSATYETKKGEKVYLLIFGPRYAEAAKEVCDALNAGKSHADCKAIIDRATEARAQQREEWKARRAERNAQVAQPAAETTTGYTDKDVADMLKRIMAGEAIPENIKAAMAA